MIELRPVSLCDYDFDEFIKQIDVNKTYLIKLRDKWVTGWWSHSREWCKSGSGWDFNYGMTRIQGSSRLPDDKLGEEFKEIYEIFDPDLVVKEAINVLSK